MTVTSYTLSGYYGPTHDPTAKTRAGIKALLKRRGWTTRSAAAALGVSYVHLSLVLNGHRHSIRLLRRATTLPSTRRRAQL